MKKCLSCLFILFVLVSCRAIPGIGDEQEQVVSSAGGGSGRIHHNLTVNIDPGSGEILARDAITVPDGLHRPFTLILHEGLKPKIVTPGVVLVRQSSGKRSVPVEMFVVDLPRGVSTFMIEYGGIIRHPLDAPEKEQSRGFRQTPGIISPEGVYLAGSSFWYPLIEEGMVTFSLRVRLPAGWTAVSQGERKQASGQGDHSDVIWESPELQDQIFLVAAGFHEYSDSRKPVQAMVFLRTDDRQLAEKYLDATAQYLEIYERLIGPYPYKKFALVENFWDTGFGMPSFTLLGPKIIRLPFIITSSYPHEILHNWWGNSVFPDYRTGNWSEGLTAYLSDHLLKEQQGSAAEYRQTTLQKYADYVTSERDFPLNQFVSRHGSPSEAVGYGKSLMLFHMLRSTLGDETFIRGLRSFYRNQQFRFASFGDLRKDFETVSGRNLEAEFNQWLVRPGAPVLRLNDPKTEQSGSQFVLTARMEQTQPGEPYRLAVPVAVTMEGVDHAFQSVVRMEGKSLGFSFSLPARPLRIDVDPEFDIFRRLDRKELPPAITQALGAKRMLIILPSSSREAGQRSYSGLAEMLRKSGPDEVQVLTDQELKELPSDHSVVVLGWENRFMGIAAAALSGFDVEVQKDGMKIGKTIAEKGKHAVVATAANPANSELSLLFIASEAPDAIPGLGRKLPHYHKYSYLIFEGDEPVNIAKGRWTVTSSPMTAPVPLADGRIPQAAMGKLLPREPLVKSAQPFSKDRMIGTIRVLSAAGMKGRGFGSPELDRAAEYIAKSFEAAGLLPGGEGGSYFQSWKDSGGEPEGVVSVRNVIGVLPGKKPEFAGESIVIGAHYDHLGLGWPDARAGQKGEIHYGADDNASGVAVLTEVAQVMGKGMKPDRSIVFVAFAGEEAGRRGSRRFVNHYTLYPPEKIAGMMNIDTVGRLEKKKLLLLGAESAREWVHIFRRAGSLAGVEVEVVNEELDASDQISFQEKGIPAVQLFSGPHLDYHRPTDTPDKIDGEGLVKVAGVVKEAVVYLTGRDHPLTNVSRAGHVEPSRQEGRKVTLGTIPDFAYTGKGVRLSGVVPGSPAELSGLREGDIIVRIGTESIARLKDLSEALKKLAPGTRVEVTFLRHGQENMVKAIVEAR